MLDHRSISSHCIDVASGLLGENGYYSYDKKVEAWCLDGFHVRMAEIEETF